VAKIFIDENEGLEKGLKRFKRMREREGIVRAFKNKQFYTKPSDERREKKKKAIRRLRESSDNEKTEELRDLHSAVAAWGTYERHVREAREWPFNAVILRRLAASTLVPAIVYLLKVFLGIRLFG